MDYDAIAGAILGTFSGGSSQIQPPPPISPLNRAVIELRRRGHSVQPAEGIPGLWNVSGMPELTTAQLIAAAFNPFAGEPSDSP